MMRITYFCFVIGALAGTVGITLGIHMGIAQDFTLAPAHAHINLLGWVSMTLYGLYHRGAPQDTQALRWLQVGLGAAGFPVFTGGLAVYLATGNDTLFSLVVAGSLACFVSMVLFAVILVRDAWRQRPAHAQWHMPTVTSG
jgi:cbb3-type cytochrome oxidase subunit 1